MSEVIQFDDAVTGQNADDLAYLLRQHQQDYPGGMDWVDKSIEEYRCGAKYAMLGRVGLRPVAACLAQRHPADPTVLEINHLSQDISVAGRDFAGFALTQVEHLGPQLYPGVIIAEGNTKVTNKAMVRFAVSHGFTASTVQVLGSRFGHNGMPDVTLIKPLRSARLPRLTP